MLRLWLVSSLMVANALSASCPSPLCTCRWKGGKQAVECMDRGLIAVPESADPETQVLDLSVNNLQILPREVFLRAGLINLQRIYLRSCRIGQIDDTSFKKLTNLIELDLSNNLLTNIPTSTFKDIPFLRELILSNNPIQKIEPNAFKTIHGLVKLDLSGCEIQMIAPKAFDGIDMLESLKLNGNRLSELRLQTVETLSRLHGVDLHDNPWHCDCRLRSVKEWLTHNNIPYTITPICSGGPERVIDKTFSELHLDDFACKPEILPSSRHYEPISGDNATITCRANAVPSAHIKWYWNGRQLVNNSAFSSHQRIYVFETGKQEKRSTLVLTNVQEVDSGEFYCVAENRAGSAEANFTVRVALRPLGIRALGNSQIAGLSAALVILILFILVFISVLLMRLKRTPYIDAKTPGQMEVVTVVNGATVPNGKAIAVSPTQAETSSFNERKLPTDLKLCNPVQKPPRVNDPYPTASVVTAPFMSPSSNSGNNPDLINDTNKTTDEECDGMERSASGEYSRNADSLYPSSLWEQNNDESYSSRQLHYTDRTPIMDDRTSPGGSAEELNYRLAQGTNKMVGYPQDYGLPIVDGGTSAATQVNLPANAKTLRVWQKGAVPVLPPVTALKRALSYSRNSPDEGYQEGCGTDV